MDYYNRTAVQHVWEWLLADIGNEFGVAGLMGNLYAESGICPYRCEGMDYSQSMTETLTTYRAFDNAYDFARHYTTSYRRSDGTMYYGYGYSLAQWTTFSRKENYYNYVGQENIGNNQKSVEFLLYELKNGYPGVYNVLKNATSIEQASRKVLYDFEAPYQAWKQEGSRAQLSRSVYNDFSGSPPVPIGGGTLPIWLMKYIINKRRFTK